MFILAPQYILLFVMFSARQQLYNLCQRYIADRTATLKKAISDIQDAANNETKSTAGDKYETGREMMQQEINMKTAQLNEVQKLRSVLDRLDPTIENDIIIPGSVVYTNNGNYYIAVSAGKLSLEGISYYVISAESPIGTLLLGKAKGAQFDFNGQNYLIQDVL
jgi:transcription elongation GreA/GreB family factor